MYSSGVAAPSRQISMELVSSKDEFQPIFFFFFLNISASYGYNCNGTRL